MCEREIQYVYRVKKLVPTHAIISLTFLFSFTDMKTKPKKPLSLAYFESS